MKKISFFALLILAAIIGVFLTSRPSHNSSARTSAGVPPVMEPIERQAGNLPSTPSSSRDPKAAKAAIRETNQIAPLFSTPISLQDGGTKRPFEIATDELYVRQPDGDNHVVKFPKTDSPAAFAAEIQKARIEHGVDPEIILYPADFPRNEYTRRIVTRNVVIQTDSKAVADALAKSTALAFKKNLPFAPNTYVYEAPTSLDAIIFQLNNNETKTAKVSTQLAKQVATMAMPNDPFIQLQWHLKNFGQKQKQGNLTATSGIDINVESVWNYPSTDSDEYNRGQGVTIGIVDDSLQWRHPDLSPNMRNELNWDWNQGDADPSPYYVNDSHGTACAGVAAARGNNRFGVSGVAPEASLVGMRLISGPITDLDEAEAMAWKSDQIEIKSNSWGYPSVIESDLGLLYILYKNGDLANAALKYAIDFGRNGKGTIFTFAAGNSFGYFDLNRKIYVPTGARVEFADYQGSMYTIAVGAIDSSGKKSYYSQIGSALVVSAPSNGKMGIMTTDRTDYGYNLGFSENDFASSGNVTKQFGGTSSACPAVSGVIALMLQKNPDLGWRDVQEILIRSANNTFDPAGWETNGAGIKFNYKYGAGLVDAKAAVNMADGWDNLGAQKSQTISTNATTTIAAGASVNRTFNVSGTNLRVEHVTLRLTVKDIKKGDLTVALISKNGTESIFCEPHDDYENSLENWKFMTVRNWGEMSNGDWTLRITNSGATSGSLTDAELVVYGTEVGAATNPAPIVTLEASKTSLFVGSNLILTATALDKKADGSTGSVEALEAFVDGATLGKSTKGTWTIQANKAGNYTFTVNATDAEGGVATSEAVEVEVVEAPIAAWDFDTTAISPVPLATAVQGSKQYSANFGSGNLIFNGNSSNDNLWSSKNGEIWKGNGTSINSAGEMWNQSLENTALLLRSGKNIGAEKKHLIFEFSMMNRGNLNVSYAFGRNYGGFTTHTWSYSTNGITWIETQTLSPEDSTVVLNPISELSEQAKAYLRVEFTGATAAFGENRFDNIYFSASPITAAPVSEDFTVLARSTKAQVAELGSQNQADEKLETPLQVKPRGSEDSQNLDWVLEKPSIHQMLVHAEVVDGSQFLNAPGSLLSANKDGKVLGLAEPVPQTTRYDLGITSSDPAPEPLRLKVYDSKSKGILVLEEKVPFAPGTTIGSPTTPKRYKVAYQEVEQVVQVSSGWNTFTTAVHPDPATLAGAFANYDYSEGDQLIGNGVEASVVDGKWSPSGVKLEPQATYSLLRQDRTASQIILRGMAVENPSTDQPEKPVELPTVKTSANFSNSSHSHSPAPDSSSGGGSESVTTANDSKGAKKAKSSSSSKKKTGKKTKAKSY